jgi:acyl transferase domain-containing protein
VRTIVELDGIRKLMEDQLRLSRSLKERVRELEDAQHAPLAVVGTALRLPGGLTTPEEYWDFLLSDADALSGIPADRPGLHTVHDPRPDRPGSSYVDRAGFLGDIAGFDPAFFGISQREAEALDPQQRLLLETSWEAMERAGIAVRRQDRLQAGVFVGIMTSEYAERFGGKADKSGIDPYYGTGGGHSMAAGRVSYVMGLSGPAVSVDTACSSSLVALHLGAQSLRRGECRYALVGGANLVISADLMVSLCQSRALATDGRSKSFTAAADGYGRGEGVGVLVLMRLDDAEREGRPVLAVLRGSAVNHDGASSGLTVPNGPAQQEVIRAALDDARLEPAELGWVEAHGTGTSLGDPIEAGALDAVAGSGASGRHTPLAIGSVKSRIGHLEAAAGIAGLIKVVLMLRHGLIPAALGNSDHELNPLIPWDRTGLTVPRRAAEWPSGYRNRVAGISAFGMSGTNAHAVLEAHTAPTAAGSAADAHPGEQQAPAPELVVLSARHPDSLYELAVAVASGLGRLSGDRLASACHTLRVGRTAFEHRIAVTGSTGAELALALNDAVERQTGTTAGAPFAVGLRIADGAAGLAAGVDALLAGRPELAAADLPDAAPEDRLRALLAQTGLRLKDAPGPLPKDVLAALDWDGRLLPVLTRSAEDSPEALLRALGTLFAAGAEPRWAPLRPERARLVGELPTYAFRRRRCWVDETPVAVAEARSANGGETAQQGGDADLLVVEEFLREQLAEVLRADELDCGRTFMDVGGDSFSAMQLTVAIERRYGTEDVPLDDFLEDITLGELFQRLSRYIVGSGASVLPQDQEQIA